MRAVSLALASLILLSLTACSSSPPAIVDAALSCPPVPTDIVAESKRKPRVEGDTAAAIAANLIVTAHRKNAALKRAILAHEECRK
jgi:hypothetical protein